MRLQILLLAAALGLAWPAPAGATTTTARALGMGNAYSAAAIEADMAAWNPALLGLPREGQPSFAILLPSVNLGLGNNFMSLEALGGLFPDDSGNSKVLGAPAMDALFQGVGDRGWELLALESGSRVLAIAAPPLRTSLHVQTDLDVQGFGLPRGLAGLLLKGNAEAPNVSLESLRGAYAAGYASAGISHAIPLPLFKGRPAAVGVTLRYLQGLGWLKVEDASGSFRTLADGRISSDAGVRVLVTKGLDQLLSFGNQPYQAAFKPSDQLNVGSGVAADFGFATQWNESLTWGLTVGNIGFIKWNQVQDKITTFNFAPTGLALYDATDSAGVPTQRSDFDQNKPETFVPAPIRNAQKDTAGPLQGKNNVDGGLPPYARLGLMWRGELGLPPIGKGPLHFNTPPMPVLVALDLQQGFGTGYGISQTPELHLGTEFRPLFQFLPLRLGTSLGARTMVAAGAGLDLRYFKLDLAIGSMNGILGTSKGVYTAVTSQLTF